MLRCVKSGGDKGPWSETASATIAAEARCGVHATSGVAVAGAAAAADK